MKIKRTTANKIMSRAINSEERCVLGVLDQQDKLWCAETSETILQLLQDFPQALLVYNQNPDALKIKESLEFSDGQQCIEIFQDTEGVFGLRAYQQTGKIQTPVMLELDD